VTLLPLLPLLPTLPLAAFADVFKIVLGVLLSLCGLGVILMGVIAMADRRWRGGAIGAAAGAAMFALGLWLVGVIP